MSWIGPAAGFGGSILSGLFGGPQQPQYTPQQLSAFHFQMNLARLLKQYGQGVPGSSPGELAALSQDRALAGEGAQHGQQQLFAASPGGELGSSTGSQVGNLQSSQQGMFGGIDTAHLLQSLQLRQGALGEAGGLARGAAGSLGGAYTQPTPNLGGAFGNLAQMFAQQQGQQGYGGGGGGNVESPAAMQDAFNQYLFSEYGENPYSGT